MKNLSPEIHAPVTKVFYRGDMTRAAFLIAVVLLTLAFAGLTRVPGPRAVPRPVAPAAETAVERGHSVYQRYGCTMCHGVDGRGGKKNPNAETDGQIPGVIFSKEGYTAAELRQLILSGTPRIGKTEKDGPTPPYRMPGWRGVMTGEEADDLAQYLFSLYPESAGTSWR